MLSATFISDSGAIGPVVERFRYTSNERHYVLNQTNERVILSARDSLDNGEACYDWSYAEVFRLDTFEFVEGLCLEGSELTQPTEVESLSCFMEAPRVHPSSLFITDGSLILQPGSSRWDCFDLEGDPYSDGSVTVDSLRSYDGLGEAAPAYWTIEYDWLADIEQRDLIRIGDSEILLVGCEQTESDDPRCFAKSEQVEIVSEVTEFVVVACKDTAAASWKSPTKGLTPYPLIDIEAQKAGESNWVKLETSLQQTEGSVSHRLTGLDADSGYTFRIRARVAAADEDFASDWVTKSINRDEDSCGMTPVSPRRLMDTRSGFKVGRLDGSGSAYVLQVTGRGGVPSSGVSAVALNVTAVSTEAGDYGGFVTVYPCGSRPDASNLNFVSGQTLANSVIAPVSSDGKVCFYVYGRAHLLADVSGYSS